MKLCKHIEEGIIGVRDMGDVKKALHMKYSWQLTTEDNQWTRFFKANYVKGKHLSSVTPRPMCSSFWKAICKVISEVYENFPNRIREGHALF